MSSKYNPENWDVFISHAAEDKVNFARPLAESLRKSGLRVWFDEFELAVGDSLTRSIDRGLAESKYGVVVISKSFLAKNWPQKELAGLLAREEIDKKVILPIWHEVSALDLSRIAPMLADRVAIQSSIGIVECTKQLLRAMNLRFGGDEISGVWYGEAGRLQIFLAGDTVEGHYDWNGHMLAGHLQGTYRDALVWFNWWWDISPERGIGFFEHSADEQSLVGGWMFSLDVPDSLRMNMAFLRANAHHWFYRRVAARSGTGDA